MVSADDIRGIMRAYRGIDGDICQRCGGGGVVTYSSTATWRGGMGGARMTADVCDTCWGSGDANRHWTDLRKLRAEESHRIREGAAELMAQRSGVGLRMMRPCWIALIRILEREERRRKRPDGVDPFAWDALLRMWIKTLEEFAANG